MKEMHMSIGALIISDGTGQKKECLTLTKRTESVGTAQGNTIKISDDYAEPVHMEIRPTQRGDGYLLLCSLEKTNDCTRLNRAPLHGEEMFRLEDGDVITIGQTCLEFRLLDADSPLIDLEVRPAEKVTITAGNELTLKVRVYNYTANRETVALSVLDEQGVALVGWVTAFEPATLPLESQRFADALLKITPPPSVENQPSQVVITIVATWGDNRRAAKFTFLNLALRENGLPISGGTITGPLTVNGVTTLVGDLTVGGRGTIGATENGAATLSIDGDLKLRDGVAVRAFSDDDNLTESDDKTVPTAPAIRRYVDRKAQEVDPFITPAIKDTIDEEIKQIKLTIVQQIELIKLNIDQQIEQAIDARSEKHSHDIHAIPTGVIMMWSGDTDNIPNGWALCDGEKGTPNLKSKFIIGAWDKESVGKTGGNFKVTLGIEHLPPHDHANGDFNRVLRADGEYSMIPDCTDDVHYEGEIEPNLRYSEELQSVGGGEPLDITPPYYALAFIMKV
jgi:hypothetical protein